MKTPIEKIAKYDTTCPHCKKKIVGGKDWIKVHKDIWVHRDTCYADYRELIDANSPNFDAMDFVFTNADFEKATPFDPVCKQVYSYKVTIKETSIREITVDATSMEEALAKVKAKNIEIVAIKKGE